MTHDEANQLAIRYKNIWRGGPATEELREHLIEMDAGRATNALSLCAQRLDHPPSIAQLWRNYEATRSPLAYGWDRPADTGNAVSLDEHLAELERRACHDAVAADELDRWVRLRKGRDDQDSAHADAEHPDLPSTVTPKREDVP